MTTQPDARQVEEPTSVKAWRKYGWETDTVSYIDALLAANRELAKEVEAHKAEHDISDGLLKDAETRALEAQKALRKASYSFEKISKWREGALAYDRENNNPPRDFCEDVELIEGSAEFSKSETDAAIDAAAK